MICKLCGFPIRKKEKSIWEDEDILHYYSIDCWKAKNRRINSLENQQKKK
jgi:hypothetical protein